MVAISWIAHNLCYCAVMLRPSRPPAARAPGIRAFAWLCICAIACGCADVPPPAPRENGPPFVIGVLIAGWHTGLILPIAEVGPLRPLLENDPHLRYLSVGWGSRRFYMAAHPSSGDALAALFRSSSAILVQGVSLPNGLSARGARIHWVCADREELLRANRYIEASLSRRDGKPIDLGPGPVAASRFYASSGHYSMLTTCNTWTVGALQYAGLPVHARGVIFASQVGRRVAALRACPAPSP